MEEASELTLALPSLRELSRVGARLGAALAIGALIGYQRERVGKAAGLRTHMLVAMGTALFVIAAIEYGMGEDSLSRIIQGLATGIGFLGAGAIMKIEANQEIRGLTTASGIWMTAAASVAIGLGLIGVGLLAGILAWAVLAVFHRFQPKAINGPAHGNG
ncbi:MAG TPA: MgtC/SapB family protein [Steroidobacteraceae bacterium]|nr:MgtC/SapB family protein [Steroidobacteraceae bacterium]